MKARSWRACVFALAATLAGCADGHDADRTAAQPPELSARLGGQTTTFTASDRSFNLSGRTLGINDRHLFVDGNSVFEHRFTAGEGLGPTFSGDGCVRCHVNNGRSPAPDGGEVAGTVVQAPSTAPGQLNHLAIDGATPDVVLSVGWVEVGDLRRPRAVTMPTFAGPTSLRVSPPIIGVGLLEAIPGADIEALADPDDADGDGIRGVVSRTPSGEIGRFGWRASSATVTAQTQKAFRTDIGIDATEEQVELAAFYAAVLAVPAMRNSDDPDVRAGAAVFQRIGCAACHVDSFTTGPSVFASELEDQIIHPYTDLLLHDMGDELADETGSSWRTTPLWGLGLTEVVGEGEVAYLHDGRARTIDEAIRWHAGEASSAADRYRALDPVHRSQLLTFLGAL